MALPLVSVIVINFNGKHHLEACFNALVKQTYPADSLELLLIDNASHDGSVAWMAEHFPQVRVLANATNVGFAPAVNQGAVAAKGTYVALINNDAYADPRWIEAMVQLIQSQRERGVVCVGAKMLDWFGQRIDFIGGGVNFYGMGNQFFHDLPVDAVQVNQHELLFACGGAMLVDRTIFLQVGGFDEDYFAYFEDVDFGWRLWLYGYRVMLAPEAIVYHRQHGTANAMYRYQVNTLFERNALLTILKNYDEENLSRVLGVSLLLMMRRSLSEAGSALDRRSFQMGFRDHAEGAVFEMPMPRMAMSHLAALHDIFETFPAIWEKRALIQAQRTRPDREILPLFRYPMGASHHTGAYLQTQQWLVDAFDIRQLFGQTRRHRVLIISTDPLYAKLAGPGMRVVEMARYLSRDCYVVVAAPRRAEINLPDVECVAFEPDDETGITRLLSEVEVVVAQGFTLRKYPAIKALNRILVVDLYDPFHLENLQTHVNLSDSAAHAAAQTDRAVINELLKAGDFFICASERQRDFWLGALGNAGRLSPLIYAHDPTFRSLIDVVPFGAEPTPPVATQAMLKGVVPGISVTDTVVLWGGGIWEWLDPLTVIRAMQIVADQRPDVKLFFLGQHHPNPDDVPVMPMYNRAVALAQELGLLNRNVFFNDHWVEYHQRHNYLLEADIGVSAHTGHIETRFAFRTRLLDYIWAGLPMVVSAGDTLADVVAERGLGYVVAVGDVNGYATALLALAAHAPVREPYAAALKAAHTAFGWPNALQPLLQFCARPQYALDKLQLRAAAHAASSSSAESTPTPNRLVELEAVIAEKNSHIVLLESLIKRLETGRVMQILRTIQRLSQRFR